MLKLLVIGIMYLRGKLYKGASTAQVCRGEICDDAPGIATQDASGPEAVLRNGPLRWAGESPKTPSFPILPLSVT